TPHAPLSDLLALALELSEDRAIAIATHRQSDLVDAGTQVGLCLPGIRRYPQPIGARSRQTQELAFSGDTQRASVCVDKDAHLLPPLGLSVCWRASRCVKALFKKAISTACCPMRRSSSAILASSL